MTILAVLLFIFLVIGLSTGFGYLIDPNEMNEIFKDLFDKFRKYDIQDEMSFYQECLWIEQVIDSCKTRKQLLNAEKLVSLICTKYDRKVKSNIICDLRHRLNYVVDKKDWSVV